MTRYLWLTVFLSNSMSQKTGKPATGAFLFLFSNFRAEKG